MGQTTDRKSWESRAATLAKRALALLQEANLATSDVVAESKRAEAVLWTAKAVEELAAKMEMLLED